MKLTHLIPVITLLFALQTNAQSIPKEAIATSYFDYQVQPTDGEIRMGKDYTRQRQTLLDSAYAILTKRLSAEKGMKFLPLNSMEGVIKYNKFGYPRTGTSKAAKKGARDNYIKMYCNMTWSQKSSGVSAGAASLKKIKIRPILVLKIIIADKGGETIWEQKVKVKNDVELETKIARIHHWSSTSDSDPLPFMELLNKCIDEIVKL
ncbi:MAG: hypothetical protein COB85_09230 [Bacteroidetes bacterium]|nr:MAG: hypothetical protein COB85_09230 [Bacteroidota bacterium]